MYSSRIFPPLRRFSMRPVHTFSKLLLRGYPSPCFGEFGSLLYGQPNCGVRAWGACARAVCAEGRRPQQTELELEASHLNNEVFYHTVDVESCGFVRVCVRVCVRVAVAVVVAAVAVVAVVVAWAARGGSPGRGRRSLGYPPS